MNKSYALVWNATQGCWQVASELTRRRGKAGRGRVLMTAGASLIGLAFAGLAHALPTGGAVVDGKGTILAEGQQMIVDQQSHKLITNWESFNVGAQEGVTFRQPDQNAIALNRVIGNEGSSILGRIDANGQVFLVNPNGVLFGQGAQVNVGGLVASTLDIGNEDFKAARYVFNGDSAAHVVNAGAITAATGGAVELLGAQVSNTGTIQAPEGHVGLAAGSSVLLRYDNGSPVFLQIDRGATDALAHNSGVIKTASGAAQLSANATNQTLRTVVNNEGTIEAVTLKANKIGMIYLQGADHGVQVAGVLNASGAQDSSAGGKITIEGRKLNIAPTLKVSTQGGAEKETGSLALTAERMRVGDAVQMTAVSSSDTVLSGEQLAGMLKQNEVLLDGRVNMSVEDRISWQNGNALTLSSSGDIKVGGAITAYGDNARLTIGSHGGAVLIDKDVTLAGRNASLTLNSNMPELPAKHETRGAAFVTLSGANASFRANGQDYVVVQNLSQLSAIDRNPSGHYVLGNDIAGQGSFMALAGGQHEFSGVLDGLGHTISNLNIYGAGPSVGMFASIINGTVRNLKVDRAMVSGSQSPQAMQLGVLAGSNFGNISNVHVTNSMVIGSRNSHVMGGLVGNYFGGDINNASFSGNVVGNANSTAIGGLIGLAQETPRAKQISNSWATAYISGSGHRGNVAVGGLVGKNMGAHLLNVQSTGMISVQYANANIGGLVGLNAQDRTRRDTSGAIKNASSAAQISSVGAGSNVGGLVGANIAGKLSNVEAQGNVNGHYSAAIGGLIGQNTGALVEDARYEGQVRDVTAKALGGLVGNQVNGRLQRVWVNATVIGGNQANIGGIAGQIYDGSVDLADAFVNLRGGADSIIGGIVGDADNAQLQNLNVQAKLSAAQSQSGVGSAMGGIAGVLWPGSIVNANANVDIQAPRLSATGGIAGVNVGHILGVNASGSITGGSTAGGLIGVNFGGIKDATTSVQINSPNGVQGTLIASDQNHAPESLPTLQSTSKQNGSLPPIGQILANNRH